MVTIDKEKCVGCGRCVADCIVGNISMQDNKADVAKTCFLCGHCVAICPREAVRIDEYDMADVSEYKADSFMLSATNFLNAVKFRRSVRAFKEEKIPTDKLQRVLQAGRYTPTAVNYQDVRFIVVQEQLEKVKELVWQGWYDFTQELKKTDPARAKLFMRYYKAYQDDPAKDRLFFNAPALLVLAADVPLNAGLAAANVEMMAVAEGLGVMFDGYVVYAINHNQTVRELLQIGEKTVVAAMLMGYPAVNYKRTAPRRAVDAVWL